MEAWNYFKAGYDYTMGASDIAKLSASSERHKIMGTEEELLKSYFSTPRHDEFAKKLTNSEILAHITKMSQVKVGSKKLGAALKKCGFTQILERRNGNKNPDRLYLVDFVNLSVTQ